MLRISSRQEKKGPMSNTYFESALIPILLGNGDKDQPSLNTANVATQPMTLAPDPFVIGAFEDPAKSTSPGSTLEEAPLSSPSLIPNIQAMDESPDAAAASSGSPRWSQIETQLQSFDDNDDGDTSTEEDEEEELRTQPYSFHQTTMPTPGPGPGSRIVTSLSPLPSDDDEEGSGRGGGGDGSKRRNVRLDGGGAGIIMANVTDDDDRRLWKDDDEERRCVKCGCDPAAHPIVEEYAIVCKECGCEATASFAGESPTF